MVDDFGCEMIFLTSGEYFTGGYVIDDHDTD